MNNQILEGTPARSTTVSSNLRRASVPVHSLRVPPRRPRFGPIHKRGLLLWVGDLLVVNAALLVSQLGQGNLDLSWSSVERRCYWFVSISLLWIICGKAWGIFKLPQAYHLPRCLKGPMSVAAAVSILNLLIPLLTPSLPHRRSDAVGFLLLMLASVGLWRFLFARCFSTPVLDRQALVIGAGWAGSTLARTFSEFRARRRNSHLTKHYQLLGFIDDDKTKQQTSIAGLPVLGTHADLVNLARERQPLDLVLAITRRSELSPGMFKAILDCRELGVSVIPMQTLYERLTHQVPLEHSGNNLDVILPIFPSIGLRLYSLFRDAADILSALVGSCFLVLMIPIVWIANRISSPGPLFYWQERVGRSGETFTLLKFRSMVTDAEAEGVVWAKENDDRITPIGRFLRRSRLDELPQFWNILKGEMSLIGPRPERACFVEQLEKQIPFYRLRHALKPGLTGWAQVQFRYGSSVEDAFIKLRYDFYYIKNQSILLDLEILLKTVGMVIGFKGR